MRCTREVKAFGTEMSTWWMGSSSTGSHFGIASCIALARRGLERLVGAVDGVELAGDEGHRHVHHREAQGPVAQIFHHAFLDRGDVVARDGAAHHRVDEAVAGAARQRLHLDLDVGELAVAAATGA